ncbi:MAG TPA: outer membrane beta-barrel protein [Gemmatimonadales bacterium]|nr:outer membrane beta-barrel protein [Gemmatimonadales bacterium]
MRRLLTSIAFSAAIAAPVAAQGHDTFEIDPSIGAYLPTGHMYRDNQQTWSESNALLYGVHLGFGALNRVSLELTLDAGSSPIRIQDTGQPDETFPARMLIMGIRLRYNARTGSVTTPYVTAGAAYVNPTGDVTVGTHASGWAASLGVGLRVVTTGHLVGRLEFSDYHYHRKLFGGPTSQGNDDLLLSVGVGLMP